MKRARKQQGRRPIERQYLSVLNETVTLDVWSAICRKAADDALAGDPRARDWLSRWLLSLETKVLTTLAAEEMDEPDAEAADIADRQQSLQYRRHHEQKIRRLNGFGRTAG